ncbi:MAG: type VI secretion system contractile sheath large subunit [Treponema sp.]|nr:type VI secretion system contractile sheath large subunit [Treponema sp.]
MNNIPKDPALLKALSQKAQEGAAGGEAAGAARDKYDRWEAELSKNGFMHLIHWKNTDHAVFLGGQTVNKLAEYDSPDATANANLSARLFLRPAVLRS